MADADHSKTNKELTRTKPPINATGGAGKTPEVQPPQGLVVSIHDVSPLTWKRVRQCLADLRREGIEQTSLLVIPDHHRKAPMNQDPEFCDWLAGEKDAGHEIVLHGLEHLREKPAESPNKEGVKDRFTTSFYTAGEGEFYDLNLKEALERIRHGQKIFQELNLSATGFVAPAWLLSEDAQWAAQRCGFDYTTRVGSITDLVHNRTFDSRALVWSVRSGWRRVLSKLWNSWLNDRLETNPLIRLAIHPVDVAYPAIWKQILHLANTRESARPVMTYHQWITKWRETDKPPSLVAPKDPDLPGLP